MIPSDFSNFSLQNFEYFSPKDAAEKVTKRKIERKENIITKKSKIEHKFAHPLKNIFKSSPAFFEVDPNELEECLKGQISPQKTDMMLWKHIYRLYALYTFSEEIPEDYLEIPDFIHLETILKIASPRNSKAHATATKLIEKLEADKTLSPMASLKLIKNDILVDDKLLLHVLCDRYGRNSGFEGMPSQKGIEFALKCFEMPEICSLINTLTWGSLKTKQEEILALLHTAHSFETLFNEFIAIESAVKSINDDEKKRLIFLAKRKYLPEFVEKFRAFFEKTLNEKKSILMAGGWTGSVGGHCVYYKIDLQNDGRTTFTIFNRGEGVDRHGTTNLDEPERVLSALQIKNIAQEDLFENTFIQGLIELKVFPDHVNYHSCTTPTNYKGSHLYDALLPLLKGEVVIHDNIDSLELMREQESGTCAWKSLIAFIRSKLSYPEYRLWNTFVQETALLNYFDGNAHKIVTESSSRSLFEKSLESFSSIQKSMELDMPLWTDDYQEIKMHIDFLYDALEHSEIQFLDNKKAKNKNPFSKEPFPTYVGSLVPEDKNEWDSTFNFNENSALKTIETPPKGFAIDLFETIRTKKWSSATLNTDLKSSVQELEILFKNEEYTAVFHAFIETMLHMPHFECDFWHYFDINSTKELMITLSRLQQLFYQSSDSYSTMELAKTFKPVVALYKALALQDLLIAGRTELLDMEGLDSPPDYRELEFLLTNPDQDRDFEHYGTPFQSASLRDPQASDELESIYSYLEERFQNSMLFYRPKTADVEVNIDDEDRKPGTFKSFSSYKQDEIAEDTTNPELQYIIKKIDALTEKELIEIESLKEATFPKNDEISKKFVRADRFRDYDIELKVCLVLTHDSIAKKILPDHFLAYRSQMERTWTWMHNIANKNDLFDKSLEIGESKEDNNTCIYKLSNQVSTTALKTFLEGGIAVYLSNVDRSQGLLADVFNLIQNKKDHRFQREFTPSFASQEEIKEIEHILYAENLAIMSVLSFFTKHPEKLDQVDYRIFLNLVLFERNLLQIECQKNPFFLETLRRFLEKAYERAKHLNNIFACCDLTVLASKVGLEIQIDELKVFLKTSVDPTVRINVARSLIVCLGKKETLAITEVQDLLSYHQLSSASDTPTKGIDPLIFEEVCQVIWKFLPQIERSVSKDPSFFFDPLHPCLKTSWERIGAGIYRTVDKTCFFNVVEGIYQIEGATSLILPHRILSDPNYKKIFPTPLPVSGFVNDQGSVVYQIQKDEKKYTLCIVKEDLKIQSQVEGSLKTYIDFDNQDLFPKDFDIEDLIPFTLLDYWNLWGYQIGSSYIFEITDCEDHELYICRADYSQENGFKITFQKAGNEKLNLLELKEDMSQGYDSLLKFCKDVLFWGRDDGCLEHIEIPTLELTFTSKTLGFSRIRLECHEHPGFYLDTNQYVEPLARFLFEAYIVLRDDNGRKKVLVNLKRLTHSHLNEYHILEYNQNITDAKRRLTAPGKVEKLILALIAYYSKTEKGFILVRQTLKSHLFTKENISPEEAYILKVIATSNTKGDPREIYIKLKASYLLLEAKHQDIYAILSSNDLQKYIRNQLLGFTLSPEEFTTLYAALVKLNKIQIQRNAVALLKQYLPDLKSNSLINFVKNIHTPNSVQEETPLKYPNISLPNSHFDKVNPDHLLLTKPKEIYLFWECMEIFKSQAYDKIEVLRKQITLLNSEDYGRGFVRILDCLSSNLHIEEVRHFIAKCVTIKENHIENSNFKTWEKFKEDFNQLADKYPSTSPIKGLIIPKSTVVPSTAYPYLRSLQTSHQPANVSTGQQFLQKRRSFAPHSIPEIYLTPPEYDDYFYTKGCLTSPIEKINIEKRIETALKVLELEVKEPSASSEDDSESSSSLVAINPLTKKVLRELKAGIIKSCIEKKGEEIYVHNVDFLIKELRAYIKEKQNELDAMELYLIHFAKNQSFSLDFNFEEKRSQVHLGLFDLIFLYAKSELSTLNPIDEMDGIEEKMTAFLVKATEVQKWKRCLKTALRIQEKSQDLNLLIYELAQGFKAERVFDPVNYPAALALEYAGNILVREEQFQKFKMLNENTNCILQMIPGSGKTSVLVKLLALLNADGKKLSCLILPEELFQSMQGEIIDGGLSFFNQMIMPLTVTREGCKSLEDLEKIKNDLLFLIKNKGAVITSPSSIHTFYLLFIEALCFTTTQYTDPRLSTLKDILNIFKNECRALMDEIDIIQDIKKFINFSLGETLGLNPEDRELIAFIHEMIIEKKEITESLKFKFFPKVAGKDAKLFTKKLYNPLKSFIAKQVLLYLGKDYEELRTQSNEALDDIFHFLVHENLEGAKRAVALIDQFQNQALKNSLGLAKEQINALLPSTLTFNCMEDYGFSISSEKDIVIPYEKGNPIEGSRFGHPHEAANYTMQTALSVGISVNALDKALNLIKEDIIKDMLLGITPEETAGYRRFKELWKGGEPINPLAITDEQLSAIHKSINGSQEITLHFAKNYLLPLIEFDTRKLSSPVGMLYFLFGEQMEGFSGTLGNSDTFPIGVKCYPEPIIDGKTISLLVKHFLEGAQDVIVIEEETEDAIREAIKGIKSKEPVAALIDGGGYLNQESPETLMRVWQNELSTNLLCHDNKGDLFLQKTSGKENPSLAKAEPHERLTVYRQPYTTGTDIEQPPNAVGIVTISRNVMLRDIIQNVRRMRQLDGNQRIRFMLSKDVLKLITSTLNIKMKNVDTIAILKFALLNQINRLQEDAVKSSLQQILTAVQSEILKTMLETPFFEFFSSVLGPVMEAVFAPKHSSNAWDMYGCVSEEKSIAHILKEESLKVMSSLTGSLNKAPGLQNAFNLKAIEERIGKLNANTLLPDKSIINSTSQMSQQVKVQTKQQAQVQEAQKVLTSFEIPVTWKAFSWENHVYAHTKEDLSFVRLDFPNPQVIIPDECSFSFYPFSQYTGDTIYADKLMLSVNLGLPTPFIINQSKPFGFNQEIISHAMIIQHRQGESIVLMSPFDVSIAKDLERFPDNCCLFNLVLGQERVGNTFNLNKIIGNDDAHLALLQGKLLAGFWQFTKPEKALLKQWIRRYDTSALSHFFKNTIFKHYFEGELLCARIAELFLNDK